MRRGDVCDHAYGLAFVNGLTRCHPCSNWLVGGDDVLRMVDRDRWLRDHNTCEADDTVAGSKNKRARGGEYVDSAVTRKVGVGKFVKRAGHCGRKGRSCSGADVFPRVGGSGSRAGKTG